MADGRFRLILANGAGTFDHVYDRVILTIPFAVMRAAVDFAKAGFSPLKVQSINALQMGASMQDSAAVHAAQVVQRRLQQRDQAAGGRF